MTEAGELNGGSRSIGGRILAFAALAVAALLVAKWVPYGGKIAAVAGTGTWEGESLLAPGEAGAGLRAGWEFLLSYGDAVWLALVAAMLIGAATEALVPRDWLSRLGRWGPVGGGLLALPGMMCTCCTAPVVNSLRRSGASTATSVAYWLGNPVLNPAVLIFLVLVGPWQWAVTRVAVGMVLVFGVAALVGRFVTSPAGPTGTAVADGDSVGRRFVRALARFGLVLVPEYVVLVFVIGALRPWLLPLGEEFARATVVAILIAAVLGTLAVLPTGGEIPILLGLTVAGFAPAVAGVLLITLPAVSLPSMLMVAKSLTWRVTAVVMGAVVAAGLLGGVVLTVLMASS